MIEDLSPSKDIDQKRKKNMHAATVEGRMFAETAYLQDDAGFRET